MSGSGWPSARALLDLFEADGAAPAPAGAQPILDVAAALYDTNAELWRQEDEVRVEELADAAVARLRRSIQELNMRRNQLIERLNDSYAAQLPTVPAAVPLTESIGSAIDRLSVVVLRRQHLVHRGAHETPASAPRVAVVEAQVADLIVAIDAMLDDIVGGRRRLPAFSTAKMYGPPVRR